MRSRKGKGQRRPRRIWSFPRLLQDELDEVLGAFARLAEGDDALAPQDELLAAQRELGVALDADTT